MKGHTMSGSTRAAMAAAPAKFKYDPALYLYYLNAALALVVAFFPGLNLSTTVQAAIITIATAVLTGIGACLVRPIHVSALVAAATTALTAAAAFGLHLSDNRMAALTSGLSIVLPLILRLLVSPSAVVD
jgi:hypothetical protein